MTQISAAKIPYLQKNHTQNELAGGLSAIRQWTVRYTAADCPQLNLADLPELPTALDKLTTIPRTVRDPVADCPQYTFANSPEPTTSLDEIQALRRTVRSPLADRPQFTLPIHQRQRRL